MAKDGLTTRPWYRWSPRDFLSDPVVVVMGREQRWRYREALDFSWLSETPGVATEDVWAQWLGYGAKEWDAVAGVFAGAFVVEDGLWVQKRLRAEYEAATARKRASASGGLRAQDRLTSSALGVDPESTPSSLVEREERRESREEDRTPGTLRAPEPVLVSDREPESAPKKPRKTASKDWTESFTSVDGFWPAYPRQVGKGAALFSWLRLGAGLSRDAEIELFNAIMDGLERWKSAHKDDEPDFIPHPSTWLNQRRWEDATR